MDVIFGSMLVAVLAIAIVIGTGVSGLTYFIESLKSRLTRSRKTKTEPTH